MAAKKTKAAKKKTKTARKKTARQKSGARKRLKPAAEQRGLEAGEVLLAGYWPRFRYRPSSRHHFNATCRRPTRRGSRARSNRAARFWTR
ncbi:MAG: hypothetical protein AAEJ52_13415 [Myxococcota bacterium]